MSAEVKHADAASDTEAPDDWDAESTEGSATANGKAAEEESDGEESEEDEDSAASSGDDDEEDPTTRVLERYRKLSARRVDLVGDYAGDELFLIEGDSMLLRCFTDTKLDFSPGFQMLHAAYNVEHFLHNLVKRKCNFAIVFFESNRSLCVPATASGEDAAKYHLARTAIIRHLQINLPKVHHEIGVSVFPSYVSDEFMKYLSATGPYFVMMHDGAQTAERRGKHMKPAAAADSTPGEGRVGLRHMIVHFAERGYNVALANGLEWRDTKVMTMVLETRRLRTETTQLGDPTLPKDSRLPLDISAELTKLRDMKAGFTDRQQLAVLTVSALLKDPPAGVDASALPKLCGAFLLHQATIAHSPLSQRRTGSTKGAAGAQAFLRELASISELMVNSSTERQSTGITSDIADYIDGRLFLQLTESPSSPTGSVKDLLERLLGAVEQLGSERLQTEDTAAPTIEQSKTGNAQNGSSHIELAVLPFSNPIFDSHMESVRLKIDESVAYDQSSQSHRIFQELTHWHNAKKPIIVKVAPTPAQEKAASKQAFWAAKREQLFMAEMRTYAASLTNAVGKSLEPETVIVGAPRSSRPEKTDVGSPADSEASDNPTSASKTKPGAKKAGGGGKTAQKNAGKQAMMAQIAVDKAKRDGSASDKIVSAWHVVAKNLDAEMDTRMRFRRAREYLLGLRPGWRDVLEAECQLYMLNCVLRYWIDACRSNEQHLRVESTALIWSLATQVVQSKGLTKTIATRIALTVETLSLPPVPKVALDGLPDRKLGFTFGLPAKTESLAVKLPSKEFQLTYCGPYLERSFDSRPDPRVEFNPDGWQRKVLDGIDADKSVFVVAPTSAGKTFISFYAMRKVLEADDEGILVYVAPTKALVNQIAAEIQARYSKNFKRGGKSVWAIHTRDYRINNPTGCQILVTVPHVLQIMLLAPSNANSWSSRVRRIIFDEVHSVGNTEDGLVWEQLLLMSPCPIVALSATVGNPQEFSSWLTDTQKAIGIDLVTVQHPHRYSDLRKYFYVPPEKFAFHGIPAKTAFGTLGLDGLVGFNHVHPVGALVDRSRGVPEDLSLEPRDCLEVWLAMAKLQTKAHPIPAELDPANALPAVCRKVDILNWEKGIKTILRAWIADNTSPYDQLVQDLEHSFRAQTREDLQTTQPANQTAADVQPIKDPNDLIETTLPMLCRLHTQDALPAILFNYDRHRCEEICQALSDQLAKSELEQVKSGPKWQRELEKWEDWKKLQEKNAKNKASMKKSKPQDDTLGSKLDQQRDAADATDSRWESFNPDAPVDGYHFADHTRLQLSELDVYITQLGRRNIQQWLIDAIQRGIGVHHAGMNRKYRQVVEILFRKRFLSVIIATGTLALGINMPCKTVVFSGDNVFLTALNYRQCAGRAGRRGFDLLGNVVFQGVSRAKVCRLISSRLPDLNGHFPITTTLVLRLFTLLHESKNAKYAVGAVNALLSQPRLYMGGASFKEQTMHHLRFSIEYLRRQHLLAANGAPLNFAGLVSHLYFTENSAFAFQALLKEGYFHELCGRVNRNEKDTLELLMLVMAHLFNRIYCKQSDTEYREKIVKPSSSIVFLPPLPKKAADILRQHNRQTLDVYRTYVATFVDQHIDSEDRTLPLTGIDAGGESAGSVISNALPATKIRSPFVALSGAGDDFDSIHDLCSTTRDGVFLEEAVIPHVDIFPDETEIPLNAWLLDFFKHGDVMTIEKANGIRRSDIWFLLNDFSLVLATIVTSLLNFMKLREGTDMDMLDVMGDLDAHDEAEDNEVADSEAQSEMSGPSAADSAISMPDRSRQQAAPKKKAKDTENWEEVADHEEDLQEKEKRRAANAARLEAEMGETLEAAGGSQEGLKDVLKAFQKLHTEFQVKFKAINPSLSYTQALEDRVASLEQALAASPRSDQTITAASEVEETRVEHDGQTGPRPSGESDFQGLNIDQNGRISFHGATSFFQLVCDSQLSKRSNVQPTSSSNDGKERLVNNAWTERAFERLSSLPEAVQWLLDSHWCWVQPLFNFIYRPAFTRDLKTNGPYCSILLLNAILAHSVRWCKADARLASMLAPYEDGLYFNRLVRAGLMDAIQSGPTTIPTIQTLLLLSAQECGRGNLTQAWLYSGMAFRLVEDLGIVFDGRKYAGTVTFTTEDIEIRNRLFWSCFFWDKLIALYLGRLPTLLNSSASPPRIMLDDTAEIDTWTPHGVSAPHYAPMQAHSISCFICICALSEILHAVLVTLYNPIEQSTEAQRATCVRDQSANLSEWHDSLPQFLKITVPLTATQCPPSHIVTLNCVYHTVNILLHRPMLTSHHADADVSKNSDHLRQCLGSATAIIAIFDFAVRSFGDGHVVLSQAYAVYTAASIFLLQVQATKEVNCSGMDNLRYCISALERLKATSPGKSRVEFVNVTRLTWTAVLSSALALIHKALQPREDDTAGVTTSKHPPTEVPYWSIPSEPEISGPAHDRYAQDLQFADFDFSDIEITQEMFDAMSSIEPISANVNAGMSKDAL
ncbi:hypothetical protein LTR53_008839 [Teratosphaeriaceae sp. CCFEE 6253]|nr:hypothetical protein LTR53_008839 [Teratosphaeriaceae sp. CCFEE 6253]